MGAEVKIFCRRPVVAGREVEGSQIREVPGIAGSPTNAGRHQHCLMTWGRRCVTEECARNERDHVADLVRLTLSW